MTSTCKRLIQCFFAEFIATGLLIFAACMGCFESVLFANTNFQISLNVALVVMIVVQCFAHISGAHINPAVSIAAYINNVLSILELIVYAIAQFVGAVAGFGLLKVVSPAMPDNFCMTLPNGEINLLQAFIVEFAITSMLVIVCCAVWDPCNVKNNDSLPIRLGLTVGCLIFTASNLTGGSMNPVRSFGPAIWQWNFDYMWIYWAAPLSSSVITSLIYKYCFKTDSRTDLIGQDAI